MERKLGFASVGDPRAYKPAQERGFATDGLHRKGNPPSKGTVKFLADWNKAGKLSEPGAWTVAELRAMERAFRKGGNYPEADRLLGWLRKLGAAPKKVRPAKYGRTAGATAKVGGRDW